jgi:amino acid permease
MIHHVAASPFVVAVSLAGVGVFPDIINASLLVFTLSAASTGKHLTPNHGPIS